MKIYLYTNFTFGAGFQYADLTPKGISQSTIPSVIKADFTNGGCRMVLKSMPSEKLSYLMIKDIMYVNARKRIDEQGRKVFINFAIGADDSDLSRLRNIFKGFLANYSNAFLYLGTLYSIPAENALNYDVNYDKFMAFLNYLESSSDKITSKNGNIDNIINSKIRNCIENISFGDSLVVLKGNDENYYTRLHADLSKSNPSCIDKYCFIKETDISALLNSPSDPNDFAGFCNEMVNGMDNLECKEEICIDSNEKIGDGTIKEELQTNPKESEPDNQPSLENEYSHIKNSKEGDLQNGYVHIRYLRFLGYLAGSLAVGAAIGVIIGKIMSSN